tara:strand:+ start:545 stop:853 length:309 start_codon:yes stop_codon:yes gene_type:complete
MSNKEPELPNIDAKSFEEQSELKKEVESENPMKEWLVDYVGDKHTPEDGQVTVEMVVESMAEEFPEFLLALAEENWIRGYRQGIADVEEGQKLAAAEIASEA